MTLALPGCVGVKAPAQPASAPAPRPVVREAPRPEEGSFWVERGQPGLVIGAPHGTSDIGTDRIGQDLARLTGWGAVVVRGFSQRGPAGVRLHVNRPTESAPGAAPALEVESADARRVHDAYAGHVTAAAQGPLRLYVEVHGNGRAESAGRIEIATIGVDRDAAWRLKTLLELILDARVGGARETPRLEILVEPLNALHYTASAVKARGLLRTAPRALHIELPLSARTTHREVYTAVLADFLVQAAGVLLSVSR